MGVQKRNEEMEVTYTMEWAEMQETLGGPSGGMGREEGRDL